jgi:lysophospholipase L1-like esterase
MKGLIAVLVVLALCTAKAGAQQADTCSVPSYLLFGEGRLERVFAAATKGKSLKIVVVGTTSSTLPVRDGASNAYPARLQAALKRRLPVMTVTVATHAKPRQTAAEMAQGLGKLLLDEKPDLVVWQAGTFDAMRGVDPDEFSTKVVEGVEELQKGGADVVLMNMQYSPRTESVIALAGYADSMRWVARKRDVPLFDRLAIMRHWHETSAIDLYAATKDVSVAKRVHDCIGRALASQIIDAAHLEALESRAPQ